MANLEVLDHGAPIAFSFDDLLKYHGFGYPGGVAHAFKVMERAFPLLSPGNPPERHGISIETAFPGPGGRDAFEMVTRAVTGGRYRVDDAFAPAGTLASPKGRYFFRLAYEGGTVELVLRGGLVKDEFVDLARRGPATPAEEERLVWLKQDMADRLMSLPADQVYDRAG
ncbi:MAG: hypothetical protein ACRDY7_10250 [Acidimicrobiia bacterium]